MVILSLETSTTFGGIALSKEDKLLLQKTWQRQKDQTETITLEIEKAFNELGLKYSDLGGVAVSEGPGSFTGIRIGISIAKALAFSLGIPAVGVSSLETLAYQVDPKKISTVICAMNAFKNEVYWQKFISSSGGWEAVEEVRSSPLVTVLAAQAIPTLVLGDGPSVYGPYLPEDLKTKVIYEQRYSMNPRVQEVALLGWEALKNNSTKDWKLLNPLYVRGSEAEEKLKSGLLRPFKARKVYND